MKLTDHFGDEASFDEKIMRLFLCNLGCNTNCDKNKLKDLLKIPLLTCSWSRCDLQNTDDSLFKVYLLLAIPVHFERNRAQELRNSSTRRHNASGAS